MERFIGKNVIIFAGYAPIIGNDFNGTVTSVDDEFICLNNSVYIVKKFVLVIREE